MGRHQARTRRTAAAYCTVLPPPPASDPTAYIAEQHFRYSADMCATAYTYVTVRVMELNYIQLVGSRTGKNCAMSSLWP